MKSSTIVWAAIRNIGDSQDPGQSKQGPLNESILWLAQQLATISMAGRIVIGIGRTQEDAMRGIDVKNAGRSAMTSDLHSMLDSMFDRLESPHYGEPDPDVEGDDYESA